MKYSKTIYYIGAVFLAGVAGLYYFSSGKIIETEPKIKLSYFNSPSEFSSVIYQIIKSDGQNTDYIWFGVEPSFQRQLEISSELKKQIEQTRGAFDVVYVDQELRLTNESKNMFGNTVEVSVKDNWPALAKDIQKNEGKKIMVLTAAIYSTNLLKSNPADKVRENTQRIPTVLSMGYFALSTEDEKYNIFPCATDDKEGVAGWGCRIFNKARSQRRKVDHKKITGENPSLVGVMDSSGQKDYMILVR